MVILLHMGRIRHEQSWAKPSGFSNADCCFNAGRYLFNHARPRYFEGSDLHYEEHSFYLQVGSGGLNDPKWGQYVLINDIFVDTGSWLGWLSLFDTRGGPAWAYSFELESYFFFPNPPQQIDSGIWIYVPLSGS